MPTASYILLPNREKGLFFSAGVMSTICVVCFPPTTRGQVFSYQTPGRRPPHITRRVVKTVTREWVGVPNKRSRSECMTQSLVLSIDVCRGLTISPLRFRLPEYGK